MLPSCLDAHATPSHETGATALLPTPPIPAGACRHTRDGAGFARGAVPWVHADTHAHKPKDETIEGNRLSPARNRRRRCPSGSSEMPGMYQPSALRKETKVSKSIYVRRCRCYQSTKVHEDGVLLVRRRLRRTGRDLPDLLLLYYYSRWHRSVGWEW